MSTQQVGRGLANSVAVLTVGVAGIALSFALTSPAEAQTRKEVTITFPAEEPTTGTPVDGEGGTLVQVHVVTASAGEPTEDPVGRGVSAVERTGEHIQLTAADSEEHEVEFAAASGFTGPDGRYVTKITNYPPAGTEIVAAACEPLPPDLLHDLGMRSCLYAGDSDPTPIPANEPLLDTTSVNRDQPDTTSNAHPLNAETGPRGGSWLQGRLSGVSRRP